DRGLPLFCEKPLARTLDGCEELAQAARKVPHQVGLLLRHAPALKAMREIVRSGRYGRPMGAVLRDDQAFPIDGIYGSTWRADVNAAGGGTLIEHSIHDVDLLTWILGVPELVSGRTANFSAHPGIEDLAAVTLSYPGGATALVFSLWHQIEGRNTSRRLEIFCEEAMVWLESELGPVYVETSAGREEINAEIPAFVSRLDLAGVPEEWKVMAAAFAVEDKPFLDALTLRGPSARGTPDVEEALVAHRIVDAAYRSAAQGGIPLGI
ncbi:MAG: Gfo/Idh/MocA family oxidoreductase, partial [Actinomycetota bacterium]